ncbi:hypothetical protein [Bradyrhizobium sp. AZCC 1721]|uniref:hypothetical protein n=1 Tax=Bradyrhizobium sp. AZCC 1721 TaxID=3117016 RepID=UPI002FF3C5EA
MTSPAIASATAVLLTGAAVLLVYDLSHFSTHMVLHIASMNIIAPSVAALIVTRRLSAAPDRSGSGLRLSFRLFCSGRGIRPRSITFSSGLRQLV